MSLRGLAKDTAVYGSANVVNGVLGTIGLLMLTRALQPEQYGIIALAMTLGSLIVMWGTLSIPSGIQYYYFQAVDDRERQTTVISSGFAVVSLTVGTFVLVIAVAFLATGNFGLWQSSVTWLILAYAIAESGSLVFQTLLRNRFLPLRFAIVAVCRNALAVLIGLTLVYVFDAGVEGFMIGLALGAFTSAITGWIFNRTEFVSKPDLQVAVRLLKFSWPLAIAGGSAWLLASSDLWLLAAFTNDTLVGQYGTALRVSGVMVLVVSAVSAAWTPTVLKLWHETGDIGVLLYRFSGAWAGALAACVIAAIPPTALAVRVLVPSEYWEALPLLPALLLAAGIQGTVSFTVLGLVLKERTGWIAIAGWVAAVAGVSVALVLIPRLQMWGAAASFVFSQTLLTLLYWVLSRRAIRLRIPVGLIALQFATAIGVVLYSCVKMSADPAGSTVPVLVVCTGGALLVLVFSWRFLRSAVGDRKALTREPSGGVSVSRPPDC